MSLESAIADLVSASTQLTQSVNVTRATVEATRDSAIAQEAPVTTAKDATAASATAATTDVATTASKLTAAAADYAAQKTTKGLAAVQTSADTELKDRLHRRDPARHPFRGARPSLVMDFVRRECHRNNAAGNLEPVDLSTFMTFTRGSTATYVGPDGLIKEAAVNEPRYGYDPVTGEALGLLIEEQRTNLFSSSSDLTNWSVTNNAAYIIKGLITNPAGTLAAYTLYEMSGVVDAHQIYKEFVSTENQTYTVSIYAKAGGYDVCQFGITTKDGIYTISTFNLTTATSTPGAGHTSSMSHVGGGWYRCLVTFNSLSGASNTLVRFRTGNNGAGVASNSIHLYGPQLEAGAFPTSYIPTPATFTGRASTKTYFDSNGVLQTAASGVAVTDYGYVDGRWISKGLSLEPQATNLVLQAGNLVSSSWGKTSTTCTVSAMLAPDNVSYAAKIVESLDTGNTAHYISQNPSGVAYSTQYTGSIFLKAAERSKVRVVMFDGVSHFYSNIDLITGTISFTSPGASARVTPCGNGWYRCEVTATTGSTGSPNIGIFPCDASYATSYIGDGVSGIYAWGAQYAAGPVATSYIPTTTAQVTRAADTSTSAQVTRAAEYTNCSVANWVDVDGGTLHARTGGFISPTWNAIAQIDDGQSNSARILMDGSAGNKKPRLFVNQNAAAGLSVTDDTTLTSMESASIAGRYGQSVNAISYNGRATYSAGSGVPFGRKPPSRLCVGCIGMAYQLNGYIKQLTYFQRQLSDADLQALTILED